MLSSHENSTINVTKASARFVLSQKQKHPKNLVGLVILSLFILKMQKKKNFQILFSQLLLTGLLLFNSYAKSIGGL